MVRLGSWARNKYRSGLAATSSFHFLSVVCGRKELPIPSFIMFALPVVLSVRELINTEFTLYNPTKQHLTMYCSFALYAGMECVIWLSHTSRFRHLNLPEMIMPLTDAVIMLIIGMLFTFHVAGRVPLDVRVHTLFYYTTFAAAAVHILEIFFPRDVRLVLARVYLYFQMGVWLIAMGFILEQWEQLGETTDATIIFCVLLLANLILVVASFVGFYALGRWTCRIDPASWKEEISSQHSEMNLMSSVEISIDQEQ
jgi:hypothetical protein